MKIAIEALIVLWVIAADKSVAAQRVPRIGIVGGGIGGTSCAFYLKCLFAGRGVHIDVFEPNRIGGRLSIVNLTGGAFEEGGSVIHSKNRYMSSFLRDFGLAKKTGSDGLLGLYDGKQFVFTESKWFLKTLWNLFSRYGLGVWTLKSRIEDMLKKFDRIYSLQDRGETFLTVGALLAAIDPEFVDYLNVTTKSGFTEEGVPEVVIDEIVMATVLTNYGQNTNIHKMVGSVSVAGGVGDLWSVRGGNFLVAEHLLNASKGRWIPRAVTAVTRLPSGLLAVAAGSETETRVYDAVVLAAPQTRDAKLPIRFSGFDEVVEFHGKYHRTVCTLVEGKLSDRYFPPGSPLPDEILSVKEGLIFNSIGRVAPVAGRPGNGPPVWKVFSREPLEDSDLDALFSEVRKKRVREWLAYPHYESLAAVAAVSFRPAPGLYHANAIEWAASAMEMSVIGARNVALLVRDALSPNSPAVPKTTSTPTREDL